MIVPNPCLYNALLLLLLSIVAVSNAVNNNGNEPSSISQKQVTVTPYQYLDSEEIKNTLLELSQQYPELTTVTTSQDLFNLTTAGTAADCPFDHGDPKAINPVDNSSAVNAGCKNWFLRIEDSVQHPIGSESWKSLPEVFLSGELHGDERVGPTTVVETAKLLLKAAHCESLPRDSNSADVASNEEAKQCRLDLANAGIYNRTRKWLSRLVSTRRIIILPTANALGYYRNERVENGMDPNRDFPFDLTNSNMCMRTIAGRTINELFREHMFQLSFTFHGGMQAIGYEWGAPSHSDVKTADDSAQKEIANAYSKYAGSYNANSNSKTLYPTGDMNTLVYPVRGGMEDWAYAASWDTELVQPCTPSTYGGYAPEKTIYNNASLRMFNMLVEASDMKEPSEKHLGSDENLFVARQGVKNGNGHVSRNLRMCLLLLDLVEPYVQLLNVNTREGGVVLDADVVPLQKRFHRSCIHTKVVNVPRTDDNIVSVDWTVGGAFTIEYTQLMAAKWTDLDDKIFDCMSQPTQQNLDTLLSQKHLLQLTKRHQGATRWHRNGPDGGSKSSLIEGFLPDPIFSADIDISHFQAGDSIAVFALAKVDPDWNNNNGEEDPHSHMAQVRTNPNWHFENANKTIQGRLEWLSIPVTLVIGPADSAIKEMSVRMPPSENNLTTSQQGGSFFSKQNKVLYITLSIIVVLVMFKVLIWNKSKRAYEKKVNEEFDMVPLDVNRDAISYDDDIKVENLDLD